MNLKITDIKNCPFAFKCNKKWDVMPHVDLSESGGEIRYCSACEKKVYQCLSMTEFVEHSRLNHCVMIDKGILPDFPQLLGKPADVPKRNCKSIQSKNGFEIFLTPTSRQSIFSKFFNPLKRFLSSKP